MAKMEIIVTGDGCWPDLGDKSEKGLLIHAPDCDMQIAALSEGMKSGMPSIAIRADLPDGRVFLAETSLRALLAAADAFRAKYSQELSAKPS